MNITVNERQDVLAADIRAAVKKGWRVESQSDYQAVVVRGKRPNHILHLLLTVFTLGLWLPVWVLVTLFGREQRKVITVDAHGNISR